MIVDIIETKSFIWYGYLQLLPKTRLLN